MTRLERATLHLAAIGAALVPISSYVSAVWDLGESHSKLIYIACLPGVLFGIAAVRQWGGFGRSLPVLCFATLLAAGTCWTPTSEITRAMYMVFAFGATIPLCALIRKHQMISPTAVTFATTAACVLFYASTQPMTGQRWGSLAAFGVAMTNPAGMGIHAAAALFVLLVAMPHSAGRRTLCIPVAVALLVFCSLSASRTAALAFLAGVFFLPLGGRTKSLPSRTAVVAFAVLFGAIGILVAQALSAGDHAGPYQQLWSRVVNDEEGTLYTLSGRLEIWEAGYSAFVDSWAIGYGTGAVDSTLGLYGFRAGTSGADGIVRMYAHNIVIWLTVALGLLGLIAGGALLLAAFHRAFSGGPNWRAMALTAFLVILGGGAVTHQEPSWIIAGAVLWALLSADGRWREHRQDCDRTGFRLLNRRHCPHLVPLDRKSFAPGDLVS